MTTNEQPKVTEATVLGENCGACKWWKFIKARYSILGIDMVQCSNHPHAMWTAYNWDSMTEVDHPPGRTVCPEFKAME